MGISWILETATQCLPKVNNVLKIVLKALSSWPSFSGSLHYTIEGIIFLFLHHRVDCGSNEII